MTTPLHLEHWGADRPSAPRALLVHGLTSSGETWWQIAEGLAAAGWSVTAPDLPGHGASPRADSYRFADVADRIAALGTGFELYVGHSLGGAIGVPLLAAHPGVARRAVLIDPALLIRADRAEAAIVEFQAGLADVDPEQIAARNPRWHPRTVSARVRSTQAIAPDTIAAIVRQNSPWDVTGLAGDVSVPVHVLVASDDSALPPGLLEQLTDRDHGWSSEVVAGTGHSVHRDRPDVVLERLLG